MKYIFSVLIFSVVLLSQTFQDYLKEQDISFKTYKKNLKKEFKAYKKAYDLSLEEYKKDIAKHWKTKDISSQKKWVEYSKDYKEKKSIDYDKNQIEIEVIAKDEKEAKEKIKKAFIDIYKKDVQKAVEDDILEQKIAKKLKKTIPKTKSKQKLIADIVTKKEKKNILANIEKNKLKKIKYKQKMIYKVKIKFPSESMQRKAKNYSPIIKKQAKKAYIPRELIYAIIHSESSFNPMARSHIPAFGLMQIVPKSAGVDSYKFLYRRKRLLMA